MNAHNQARFEELTKAADKKVEAHELQDTGLAMKTTKATDEAGRPLWLIETVSVSSEVGHS